MITITISSLKSRYCKQKTGSKKYNHEFHENNHFYSCNSWLCFFVEFLDIVNFQLVHCQVLAAPAVLRAGIHHRVARIMPGVSDMSGTCMCLYQSLNSSSRDGSTQSLNARSKCLFISYTSLSIAQTLLTGFVLRPDDATHGLPFRYPGRPKPC